jgi:hypothetical protein
MLCASQSGTGFRALPTIILAVKAAQPGVAVPHKIEISFGGS